MRQALTPKMLAAVLRVRADDIKWKGYNNDPESANTPEQAAYEVLYDEYSALAKILDSLVEGDAGLIMTRSDVLKREGK